MRAPESRSRRLEQIERKLVQRPEGWTTGELAREFQVDPSTIFRDLAVLESMGTGLITKGRRYILDHRRSLHSVKLSINELLAIYLAVRLLIAMAREHNPHVVKALEKLADALRAKSIRPQRLYAHGRYDESMLRRWKCLRGAGPKGKSAAALSFLYQGRDNRAYLRTLLRRTLISVPS